MESGQQNALKTFTRATRRQRLIAGVVLLSIMACFAACSGIALYKIPIYPFACGFKQRYGLPCPTCGMTTSVLAFARGRIIDSFNAQPTGFFFCLFALTAAFFAFLIAGFGLYSPRLERRIVTLKIRYLIVALALILIAGWAFTFARALMLK